MSWYAICVKTGYEDDFCRYTDNIRDQQYAGIKYTLLVPKRKIYERKQGVRHEVIKKLFPGYVLLETNLVQEFFLHSRNSPHIIRFLRENSCFLEIRRDEIEHILMMTDYQGLIEISKAFVENERVRIIEGPLLGREGIIKKIDKRKGRAKVKFIINQKVLLIDLGIEILQKID